MPDNPHGDLLRPAQAAQIAGVHVDTVKRWNRTGRLVAIRTTGGHRRYHRADIVAITNRPAA